MRASGHVNIQRDGIVWAGENINYNYKTKKMEAVDFRARGAMPVILRCLFPGKASVAIIPTKFTPRIAPTSPPMMSPNPPRGLPGAGSIKIVPGEYFEAKNAVPLFRGAPSFYFPFYTQRLDGKGNQDFVPGIAAGHGPHPVI